ncbi:MAG TPA: GAF domain-containing protein, partial [Streptosporangiaceae bacterium]|nr:GAF domain-containing protein [Streptosporangiaceae bacterium]
RAGTVTVSDAPLAGSGAGGLSSDPAQAATAPRKPDWAELRHWPSGTVHGLCTALRSRGRTVGVLTFLRGAARPRFDRADIAYAEDVAARVAAAVDLAGTA